MTLNSNYNVIKDEKIFAPELDQWVPVTDFLQNIVDTSTGILGYDLTMKFVGYSDSKGNRWDYPTIRVYTEEEAIKLSSELNQQGYEAEVDLYEDDDGDGDGGRPIIRNIWSVQFPDLMLTGMDIPSRIEASTLEQVIECSTDLDNAMYNESI